MNHHSHDLKRAGAGALTLALALALSACGGGGGSPGATVGTGTPSGNTGGTGGTGGTTTPATPTLTLSLVNASGQATNSLSGTNQLTVKATVLDKTGKPVPNAIVAFATDNNLALLTPAAGTALTDANGVASVTMRPASLATGGAGTITATSNVAGTATSGSVNYSVGSTTLTFGTLSANPTSLQAYGSTVLSVDVLAGSTKYTDQQVNVAFSSACVTAGKATLAPVVATNNGTAQTVYRDQGCGNNDTVTVTAGGIIKPTTIQLNIAPPTAASVQFESAQPSGQSIVIKGQGGNGRTETASLKFRVVDIFNHPLAGAAVDFSASTTDVTVNKLTDTTDANGEVITTVNSGTVATSFRVKAALHANSNIYTLSDSMVVTNGLPFQGAFSLAPGKHNLDSTIQSTPTSPATMIFVMIADVNGNLVPDGTPVVFQTNMGSVGSSSQGGCITSGGGCSVGFQVQKPYAATPGQPVTPCNKAAPDNTRPGVATVCASTTDGLNTIFDKVELYFSGNQVVHAYLGGDPSKPLSMTSVNDLGSTGIGVPSVFSIKFTDVNDNPLPNGTTIAVSNATNANVQVTPNTVPDMAPASPTAGPQGATHLFTISSNQTSGCTGPVTATFNVSVSTAVSGPANNTTIIPFKLTFSCP